MVFTREQIEKVWDVFHRYGMEYDRESMYYDEGADSEFCEKHRQRLADVLGEAGLAPSDPARFGVNCEANESAPATLERPGAGNQEGGS